MKYSEIEDLTVDKISPINIENIFDVQLDNDMLDDQYYFNITKTVVIPEDLDQTNYFTYSPLQGDTWTSLAYRFYGDIRAWWLICSANNILDPTSLPKGGSTLKILNRNVAKEILTTIHT
jgi:hypothetical protein